MTGQARAASVGCSDDPLGPQARQVAGSETQLGGKDYVGVFAQLGWCLELHRGFREAKWAADHRHGAVGRVLDLSAQPAMAYLGMRKGLVQGVDLTAGHTGCTQNLCQILSAERAGEPGDFLVQLGGMLQSQGIGGKPRVSWPIVLAECGAQLRPLPVVADLDQQQAVGTGVAIGGCEQQTAVACPRR